MVYFKAKTTLSIKSINYILHTFLIVLLFLNSGTANHITELIVDDPSDCSITVEVPEDLTVCFDEEFSLNGMIFGDYDEFVWLEDGDETNYDLDEDVSIDGTTTFTLIANSIIEENIIINGDFEDGDSDFTTDYVVGTTSCFGLGFLDCEGTYGVIDDPSDGHDNFSACSDIVGGGNMLVVNGAASLQQIWCQEVCVEPGATYVFSSWAASVNPSSPAQLQFAIDGGLIGNLFSLSSSTCDWEEFEAEWTSSNETTIEICVTNQNTAAGGNDFALDGIQFLRTCEDEASFTVTHSEFEVDFNDPIEITCLETESEIALFPSPIDDYTYDWETNNGNIIEFEDDGQSIIVNEAGEYSVTITNIFGCSLDFEIEVEEDINYPELEITLSNPLNCTTPNAELEVDSDLNGIDYTWFDSDQNILIEDDEIVIDQGGLYYVTGYDPDTGCASTDSIFIDENFEEIIFEIESSNNLDCNNTSATLSVDINFESVIWNNLSTDETLGNFNTININTPGLYSAQLTFENGCESTDSILITEVPANFEYQITFDSIINCNSTISEITIDFDTSLFQFEWLSLDITEIDEFNFNILQSGTYLYQISDTLNCAIIDSIIISEDVTPPLIILNTDSLSCTNNTATIYIDNPLGELEIEWVLENGTSILNDSVTINSVSVLNFTITGVNGCTSSGVYEVASSEEIPEVTIDGNTITCKDPISELTSNVNIADVTYEWVFPDSRILTDKNISTDIPGNYSLIVTTPTGCQGSSSFEVVIDTIAPTFELPQNLILDCRINSLVGTITIENPYQQIITNGNWFDTTTLEYFINEPGFYGLEIINDNGCSLEKSIEVMIDTLAPSLSFENIQSLNCNSSGFDLEIIVENDFETLIWNGNVIPNDQLIQTITSSGLYEVTAIGSNNCESTEAVTISSSDEVPDFIATSTLIDCNNPESIINIEISSDYSEVNIFNGSILLTNELTFETQVSPLTIDVIGDDGCASTQVLFLESDTTTIDFALSALELTCERTETDINIDSPISPFEIFVSKLENGNMVDSELTVDTPGEYLVELVNSNGCISSRQITIEEVGDFPRIVNLTTSDGICESAVTVSNLEIEGGMSPYELSVDNIIFQNNNEDFVLKGAGNHYIKITDANGCTVDTTILVDEILPVSSNILPEITINQGEEIDLELTLNKPLEEIEVIDWNPKIDLTCYDCLTPIFTGQQEVTYSVYVKDNYGCETEIQTRININIDVKYFIPNVFGTSDGDNNNAFTIYDNTEDIINIEFLKIYDRWGNLMFVNKKFMPNDPSLGWDGRFNDKIVEQGVYVYFAVLELRNGKVVKESGDVTFLK